MRVRVRRACQSVSARVARFSSLAGYCVYCPNTTDPTPPSGGDAASCGVLATAASRAAASTVVLPISPFVTTVGSKFFSGRSAFSFVGANAYYLSFSSSFMVDNAFQKAAANNFTVVRTWAFLDIDFANGTNSAGTNGVWFRAWDPVSRTVVTNTAALVRLDAVVAAAKKWGIRLILTVGAVSVEIHTLVLGLPRLLSSSHRHSSPAD